MGQKQSQIHQILLGAKERRLKNCCGNFPPSSMLLWERGLCPGLQGTSSSCHLAPPMWIFPKRLPKSMSIMAWGGSSQLLCWCFSFPPIGQECWGPSLELYCSISLTTWLRQQRDGKAHEQQQQPKVALLQNILKTSSPIAHC